jgi:flagellar biosynthesis/type III secretory pathway protein FliH
MSLTSTACASGGFYTYQPGVRGVDDRAYARGYDQGLRQGEADARRNRRFDYARHGEYRNADGGYRGYGDRNAYRSLFRQGFVAGYNDGFRRYARQGYGYPPPTYRNVPPAAYPGNRRFSPAAENGHRDGYQQGREDARDRDRYDPIRASRYRSGDRGYERRYGSLEDYKREYRAAFQQGYEQGYREYRR